MTKPSLLTRPKAARLGPIQYFYASKFLEVNQSRAHLLQEQSIYPGGISETHKRGRND
jgi:hypothetical protein